MRLRERAYLCLKEILMEGAYSHIALKRWSSVEGGVSLKDKRLLWELVLGVLRWLRRIDYGLSKQIRRYKRLPEEVKLVLRLGYYQIVVLDRIPPYSAVNESVEVAKKYLPAKYHKFTNAVLRKAARLPYPVAKGDNPVSVASVACSFPEWLVDRYKRRWGMGEALLFMRSMLRPAPYTFWVNIHHVSFNQVRKTLRAEGIECKPVRGLEGEMLEVLSTVDLVDHPLYREGLLVPQDVASHLVVKILDPKPEEKILDACAAPGIKTGQIALAMGNRGMIVACELNKNRYESMVENYTRMGAAIVEPVHADVVDWVGGVNNGYFDRILVDAPCSDLGTVRRRPEIKWRRTLQDVEGFARKQMEILKALIPKVKPGGCIVYSVCSVEEEETEAVMEEILRDCGVILEPFGDLLPDFYASADRGGYAFFLTHLFNTDGFFVMKLRRVS